MGKYFTLMCSAAHVGRTSAIMRAVRVFPQLKLSQQIKILDLNEVNTANMTTRLSLTLSLMWLCISIQRSVLASASDIVNTVYAINFFSGVRAHERKCNNNFMLITRK